MTTRTDYTTDYNDLCGRCGRYHDHGGGTCEDCLHDTLYDHTDTDYDRYR